MGGISKLVSLLVVLSAAGAAAVALWHRKDKVREIWDSVGGAEGIMGSANKLVGSAGPIKDFVGQMSRLKR